MFFKAYVEELSDPALFSVVEPKTPTEMLRELWRLAKQCIQWECSTKGMTSTIDSIHPFSTVLDASPWGIVAHRSRYRNQTSHPVQPWYRMGSAFMLTMAAKTFIIRD